MSSSLAEALERFNISNVEDFVSIVLTNSADIDRLEVFEDTSDVHVIEEVKLIKQVIEDIKAKTDKIDIDDNVSGVLTMIEIIDNRLAKVEAALKSHNIDSEAFSFIMNNQEILYRMMITYKSESQIASYSTEMATLEDKFLNMDDVLMPFDYLETKETIDHLHVYSFMFDSRWFMRSGSEAFPSDTDIFTVRLSSGSWFQFRYKSTKLKNPPDEESRIFIFEAKSTFIDHNVEMIQTFEYEPAHRLIFNDLDKLPVISFSMDVWPDLSRCNMDVVFTKGPTFVKKISMPFDLPSDSTDGIILTPRDFPLVKTQKLNVPMIRELYKVTDKRDSTEYYPQLFMFEFTLLMTWMRYSSVRYGCFARIVRDISVSDLKSIASMKFLRLDDPAYVSAHTITAITRIGGVGAFNVKWLTEDLSANSLVSKRVQFAPLLENSPIVIIPFNTEGLQETYFNFPNGHHDNPLNHGYPVERQVTGQTSFMFGGPLCVYDTRNGNAPVVCNTTINLDEWIMEESKTAQIFHTQIERFDIDDNTKMIILKEPAKFVVPDWKDVAFFYRKEFYIDEANGHYKFYPFSSNRCYDVGLFVSMMGEINQPEETSSEGIKGVFPQLVPHAGYYVRRGENSWTYETDLILEGYGGQYYNHWYAGLCLTGIFVQKVKIMIFQPGYRFLHVDGKLKVEQKKRGDDKVTEHTLEVADIVLDEVVHNAITCDLTLESSPNILTSRNNESPIGTHNDFNNVLMCRFYKKSTAGQTNWPISYRYYRGLNFAHIYNINDLGDPLHPSDTWCFFGWTNSWVADNAARIDWSKFHRYDNTYHRMSYSVTNQVNVDISHQLEGRHFATQLYTNGDNPSVSVDIPCLNVRNNRFDFVSKYVNDHDWTRDTSLNTVDNLGFDQFDVNFSFTKVNVTKFTVPDDVYETTTHLQENWDNADYDFVTSSVNLVEKKYDAEVDRLQHYLGILEKKLDLKNAKKTAWDYVETVMATVITVAPIMMATYAIVFDITVNILKDLTVKRKTFLDFGQTVVWDSWTGDLALMWAALRSNSAIKSKIDKVAKSGIWKDFAPEISYRNERKFRRIHPETSKMTGSKSTSTTSRSSAIVNEKGDDFIGFNTTITKPRENRVIAHHTDFTVKAPSATQSSNPELQSKEDLFHAQLGRNWDMVPSAEKPFVYLGEYPVGSTTRSADSVDAPTGLDDVPFFNIEFENIQIPSKVSLGPNHSMPRNKVEVYTALMLFAYEQGKKKSVFSGGSHAMSTYGWDSHNMEHIVNNYRYKQASEELMRYSTIRPDNETFIERYNERLLQYNKYRRTRIDEMLATS